tara:strand:- start:117 stop:395 length:279 start_codon:yes stop_codon:yes gene_type:complete
MTRTMEMGKLAAYEYENVTNDGEDYLSSIKRFYSRTSIISNLKPMSLFLKIDLHAAGILEPEDIKVKVKEFVMQCIKYNIDGIILDGEVSEP